MFNKDRADEIQEGLIINQDDNGDLVEGPFYTGGPTSPIGLDLPTNTFYIQNEAAGISIWKKFGAGSANWRKYSAQDIPFDPSNTDITGTDVQEAIESQANRHFGKDFAQKSKVGGEQTSGFQFSTYDTLTFNVSDLSGVNKYRFGFNYFYGHNSATNDIRIEHRLDGLVIEEELRVEPKDTGTDQRIPGVFVAYASNLSPGTHSISIAYRPASASRTSRMFRSNLEIWRVE